VSLHVVKTLQLFTKVTEQSLTEIASNCVEFLFFLP